MIIAAAFYKLPALLLGHAFPEQRYDVESDGLSVKRGASEVLRFEYYQVPVAYSMIALAERSSGHEFQPIQEYVCYWAAFNAVYSKIADISGCALATLVFDNDEPLCANMSDTTLFRLLV